MYNLLMANPKGKIHIAWSPQFAYAIGLIVSDGNLSPDKRHINFTSKDRELVDHFKKALNIKNKIGIKARGGEKTKKYFVVQFGDVLFCRFLENIGLMCNKSKNLKSVTLPDEFFNHFIRGLFDGDGSFYSYRDPRWKSSLMFYTSFASASPIFIRWLQSKITALYGITGHITKAKGSVEQLKFAKRESKIIINNMYQNTVNLYLKRKHLKIFSTLSIVGLPKKNARMVKLVDTQA